jgi:pSer/pThr/pTyr-binding forkhead associated (FHA) protein
MNDIKYPKLKIISAQNRGAVFVLKKKRYTCGRSESNDIVFDDSSLSSSHCELLKNGSTYIIRDTNSTNGTVVNEVPINEKELKNNDIVKMGGVELLYDSEICEEMSVPKISPALNIDLHDHDVSPINEMRNISPFAEKGKRINKVYQTAIRTVIALLALTVIFLLIWLFSIFYHQ